MSSIQYISKFFGHKNTTRFVVIGASNNPSKFGYKILKWYVSRSLPVTPVNPTSNEILGLPVSNSLTSCANQNPEATLSISVITPPSVSLSLIDELEQLEKRINCIWFQPGSYDATVIKKLADIGLADRVIHQGNCILVQGDKGLSDFYDKNLKL